jgi:hypothetical protein
MVRIAVLGTLGVLLLALLFYPDPPLPPLTPAESRPFSWDWAQLFQSLEKEFKEARGLSIERAAREMNDIEIEGLANRYDLPCWTLMGMVRKALSDRRVELSPNLGIFKRTANS